jgi:hypothetical protein
MLDILEWLQKRASRELLLIISIGFWTGLRVGSILDLKIQTVANAFFDSMTCTYRLAVGPSADPPVATKFGMNGHVLIPTALLHELQEYAESTRRLLRQGRADDSSRKYLFLNRFGQPYNRKKGTGIQVEMHRLKKAAEKEGFCAFLGFYIHRTRATFATELMRVALKYLPIGDAVPFVASALLRLATARIQLEEPVADPTTVFNRPTTMRRYFPQLAADRQDKPPVDELTMSLTDNLAIVDVWTGSAELKIPEVDGEDMHLIAPLRVGRGYRLGMAYSVTDLRILKNYVE